MRPASFFDNFLHDLLTNVLIYEILFMNRAGV